MRFAGRLAAVSLISMTVSGAAFAAEPNFGYKYLDAEYHSNSLDGEDGDGYRIEGSFAAGSNYFIIIGLNDDTVDAANSETVRGVLVPNDTLTVTADVGIGKKDLTIGFGGAWPISESVDFTGQFLYLDSEISADLGGSYRYDDGAGYTESGSVCSVDPALCGSDSIDDTGFALRAGVRGAVSESFELYGDLAYYNLDLIDDAKDFGLDLGKTGIEVGTRFAATGNFMITLGYLKQGDLKSIQLGARLDL